MFPSREWPVVMPSQPSTIDTPTFPHMCRQVHSPLGHRHCPLWYIPRDGTPNKQIQCETRGSVGAFHDVENHQFLCGIIYSSAIAHIYVSLPQVSYHITASWRKPTVPRAVRRELWELVVCLPQLDHGREMRPIILF